MFIVMLYVDGIANPFGMRFKDSEKALEVWKLISNLPINDPTSGKANRVFVEDDYGQRVQCSRQQVKATHFMPVVSDLEAQADVQLLATQENARLQARAQRDPTLMLHSAAAQLGGSGRLIRPA
jgi:hypothetical protein